MALMPPPVVASVRWMRRIARFGAAIAALVVLVPELGLSRENDVGVADDIAAANLDGATDQLAAKDMDVGRYYLAKRDYPAAVNRFRTVVTKYRATRHVDEALERLTEVYFALGVVKEARTAAAVLGRKFPDSRWYADAHDLLKQAGFEPHEDEDSWISRAFR